jgi:membrane protease YdiL (CAAX protease family)
MTALPLRLAVTAGVEIGYAILTRTWLRENLQGVELELAITAARAATAAIYWLLYGDLLAARRGAAAPPVRPRLVWAGAAVALLIPFLFRGWSPGGGVGTALVFALASVVVGFREELLYRAILLGLLEPRLGRLGALALSTVLFVIYHYGAQPFTALAITEIACMSLLLGLMYLSSGSLLQVAALHSIYDAAWFFGPYLQAPFPDSWRPAFLVGALILVVAGTAGVRPLARSK